MTVQQSKNPISSLSSFQKQTNIPQKVFNQADWKPPYRGIKLNKYISNPVHRDFLHTLGIKGTRYGLLLDYSDLDLMVILGFPHPDTGKPLTYKDFKEKPLSAQQWATYRKRLQRIMSPLENDGWIQRRTEKCHREGRVITKRFIELISLEKWKKEHLKDDSLQPNKISDGTIISTNNNPIHPNKISDGTQMSPNTYTNKNLKDFYPTLPQAENAEKQTEDMNQWVNTQGLLNIAHKEPEKLNAPSSGIRELQIKVLRDALAYEKQRVDYKLWVSLLLCMGFSKRSLKIFRKWIFEPCLQYKPQTFYNILEALYNSFSAKNSINNAGAWLMAEFYAVAGIYRISPNKKVTAEGTKERKKESVPKNPSLKLSKEKKTQQKLKKFLPQWEQFKQCIVERLDPEEYEAWFDDIYLAEVSEDRVVFAGISHPLFRDDILKNHDSLFREILDELFSELVPFEHRTIQYVVEKR